MLGELLDSLDLDEIGREATRLRFLKGMREIAGPDPSPLVRLLALGVALIKLEGELADLTFIQEGRGSPFFGDNLRWRAFVDKRLSAKIRTLAYVRHVEASTIQQTVETLRIAS
jgi:hypothetical protein